MASVSSSSRFLCPHSLHRNLISLNLLFSPSSLSFQLCPLHCRLRHCPAVKNGSEGRGGSDPYAPELLRKPVISPEFELSSAGEESADENEKKRVSRDGEAWVDWEDQILEDTVPLVGFVRMILHSGKYNSGDRLSREHQKTILERLLPHHPEYTKKIGCGVDYITVGYHPNFERSRCLFIVRKDGELVDFSYWKCIKGLIRKNYPLYADSFILRHFRNRRQID